MGLKVVLFELLRSVAEGWGPEGALPKFEGGWLGEDLGMLGTVLMLGVVEMECWPVEARGPESVVPPECRSDARSLGVLGRKPTWSRDVDG